MKIIRLLPLTGLAIIALSWFSHDLTRKHTATADDPKQAVSPLLKNNTYRKLEQKAAIARQFVNQKGFNESICFLIDMSLPSGENRFFIYNLKKDTLQNAGLVAHGNCFEYWLEGRKFSNKVGSGCTSLGKYRVGYSYTGKFGLSYKLYGLETTDNNAFERTVVLHAHSCIPETEVKDEICQSNGCPMVSPGLLQQLKSIINTSKKPLLLWIYE